MWMLILAGCGVSLGDHCVTTRDDNGDIRDITVREMEGKRLATETVRFSLLGEPAAVGTNLYEGGLWVYQAFDTFLVDPDLTRETFIEYDELDRVVSREIYSLPDGNLEGSHQYTWDGDRLATTTNSTLFTSWDENWTWSGNQAQVEQIFLGGRVIPQVREFVPSPLTWPLLSPDQDLPYLAFTGIGVDENGNGAIDEEERVWEQEVDEKGVPSFSRLYDTTGALFSQIEWGVCP